MLQIFAFLSHEFPEKSTNHQSRSAKSRNSIRFLEIGNCCTSRIKKDKDRAEIQSQFLEKKDITCGKSHIKNLGGVRTAVGSITRRLFTADK